jgi:hypothetical protein
MGLDEAALPRFMNRLHKRYGNWAWLRRSSDKGVCRLSFDRLRTLGWLLSTAVAIPLLMIWLFSGKIMASLAHQKYMSGPVFLAIFCSWIGLFLGIIVFIAIRQSRRGDHLRYEPATNRMELPRLGVEIHNARRQVTFSHERYPGMDNDVVELNVVVDGGRRVFLQSSNPRGQIEKISRWLAELGFPVTRHDFTAKGSR